eukprot:TRINITY_DN209_c0_g3_i1.p1 TRINITY_DN209_c0_g3~~TRINITY_DN209_c0_g3_i1.p1  ORF type:complete len:180 (-),score=12.48 TRINITY_DN209_c0_g3_i1:309-848(-)
MYSRSSSPIPIAFSPSRFSEGSTLQSALEIRVPTDSLEDCDYAELQLSPMAGSHGTLHLNPAVQVHKFDRVRFSSTQTAFSHSVDLELKGIESMSWSDLLSRLSSEDLEDLAENARMIFDREYGETEDEDVLDGPGWGKLQRDEPSKKKDAAQLIEQLLQWIRRVLIERGALYSWNANL